MKLRPIAFSGIFVLFLYVLSEILLRLGLLFFGYPFFRPSDYLYSRFYPYVKEVRSKEIRRGGEVKNVLILGGSVVSTAWTHMESRLDTILQEHYSKGTRFVFYNVAEAGHTSSDNVLKYSLLEDKRFDLVLYYEAINENRANNVPTEHFRQDYSHMRWYHDIDLLQSHPEIDITVIPYVLGKVIGSVRDRLERRVYISNGEVDPQYAQYGSDIKTEEAYRRNLEEIIAIAKKRGDKLLLMSYASFFPEHVVLTGEEKDMEHFAGCNRFVATPVVMWGRPENVRKGIDVHNRVLRELASKHNMLFLDMERRMPKDQKLFCDVCHLSGPGAQRFANEIAEFIVRQKLLE
nr:hypothetical protein [uncultured Dyadobacter sp.]